MFFLLKQKSNSVNLIYLLFFVCRIISSSYYTFRKHFIFSTFVESSVHFDFHIEKIFCSPIRDIILGRKLEFI